MEPLPIFIPPQPPALAVPSSPNYHKIVKSAHNSILAVKRNEIETVVILNRQRLRQSQAQLVKSGSPAWELGGLLPPEDLPSTPEATDPPVSTESLNAPAIAIGSKVKVTTTSWNVGEDVAIESVTEIPIVTMEHVKKNPPYSLWQSTPRNYVVNNQREERHHCPYFDEATFTEDMRLLYKLDTYAKEDELVDVGDDEVFYNTVSRLHTLEKELGKRSASVTDDNQWSQMIQETTIVRPSTSASLSPAGGSSFKPAAPEDLFTPSISWFEALSKVMKVGPAEKLREKFATLLKKYHPIIRNLHTPGLNLDNDSNQITYSADSAMDSYRQMFCRKCYIYNCPFHIHDGVAEEYITKNNYPELPPRDPCSVSCYLHDLMTEEDGKYLRSKGQLDWGLKGRRMWGPNDVSLCRVLLHVFKDNYCNIARIMSTNCRIVQLFANAEKPKEADSSAGAGPSSQQVLNSSRNNAHKIRKPTRNVYTKGISSQEVFLKTVFKPCFHPEMECTASICTCLESSLPCEKYCTCPPNCIHRASGCKCEGRCNTRACPCYASQRECDPDLCFSCGSNLYHTEFASCRNIGIQRLWRKHLKMAISNIPEAGWGIFAMEPISKGELIEEYVGELITDKEADRRALEYQKRCHTFLFELNTEYSIDAQRKGSKVRFANHADRPNTVVKVMKVNTDQRIGIYAARDIMPHEELYLNYRNVIEEHNAAKQPGRGSRRRRYPSKTVLPRRMSISND